MKVLTIGEPLVVFASMDLDKSLSQAQHFTKYIAGAELNVAIGLSRLGHEVSYISQVGKDFIGEYIINEVKEFGIDNKYINVDKRYRTGFYFKEYVSNNDPGIEYYRKNSAASKYDISLLDKIDFSKIDLIHLTGIFAGISKEAEKIADKLTDIAKEKNILLSFDPNLRESLWESEEYMLKTINSLSLKASILLPGLKEARKLTGLNKVEEIFEYYFKNSDTLKIVIIKDGSKTVYVKERGKAIEKFETYKVKNVIDTVGAGDGFAVGIISGIIENLDIHSCVKRACAIGAMAVQVHGDNEGYPNRRQLEDFIAKNK